MGHSGEALKEVHPKAAEKLASQLSSDLLDTTRLRGEVSPGGPRAVTYDQEDGEYSVRHSWSVSELSPEELTRGFERLRDELPKKGWRLTKYGHANSKARQLQIKAIHEKDDFSVHAELLIRSTKPKQSPNASQEDLIYFAVVSPGYRSPEGVNPNDY
ncbi:hypothetical protein LRS74_11395 [Streptomyces sp. LX-29]|uniref:hypothetical protein n=1 Tax=Streptomyces sp. LX-29 TaxID=2900152 RepID=UPI00240E09AA|nr:hypothetical protein [Streptomyces sp. LX-29]WFB07590.1 hypothetical protein LRS74_11395 [Streptomyces sp. LX-29]